MSTVHETIEQVLLPRLLYAENTRAIRTVNSNDRVINALTGTARLQALHLVRANNILSVSNSDVGSKGSSSENKESFLRLSVGAMLCNSMHCDCAGYYSTVVVRAYRKMTQASSYQAQSPEPAMTTLSFCSLLLGCSMMGIAFQIAPLRPEKRNLARSFHGGPFGLLKEPFVKSSLSDTEEGDDDPFSKMSWAEIDALERDAFQARMARQSTDRSAPLVGETISYRWRQDEDWIFMDVPLPRLPNRRDINLAIGPSTFQLNVRSIDEVDIDGEWVGEVEAQTVGYEIEEGTSDCDHRLVIRAKKKVEEGTSEMWYGLLRDEVKLPTVRFAWAGPHYSWRQSPDRFTFTLTVPTHTTRADVRVRFSPDGRSWKLEVSTMPEFGALVGNFWGTIRPAESLWLLISEEANDGSSRGRGSDSRVKGIDTTTAERVLQLEVEISKRPNFNAGEKLLWWPAFMENEIPGLPFPVRGPVSYE